MDPDRFHPDDSELPPALPAERPFRIGFSGRLVEEKGLLVLLQALHNLSGPWELRIMGAGPLQPRMEQEAEALGIGPRITFMGTVASEEVPARLRGFDVLVNPSLTWQQGRTKWKEQFGRSFIEAIDRKSTRLNSSHIQKSRMPSSA